MRDGKVATRKVDVDRGESPMLPIRKCCIPCMYTSPGEFADGTESYDGIDGPRAARMTGLCLKASNNFVRVISPEPRRITEIHQIVLL